MKKTVAEVIVEQLSYYGVKKIYGVTGDAIIGLLDAIAKQDEIEFIAVRHESVAAFMASAEAKLTGNIAVCTATMGPGATNLLNGLGDAYSDKAPVLVITGQAPTDKIGTDFQQYVDQQELFKPFAAYSANLSNGDAVVDIMQKAAQVSVQQRAVSHISIPKDLFKMESAAQAKPLPTVLKGTFSIDLKDLEEVVAVMKNAKKPMILAGAGAEKAAPTIVKLAKQWGAGILYSLGGKGIFPNSTEHLLQGIGEGGNPYAKDIFKDADVVLVAGATWWPDGYVPENAKIIVIDLHIENANKRMPVDFGIKGDTQHIVPVLLQGIADYVTNKEWVERVTQTKEKWEEVNESEGLVNGFPVHPSRVVRAIERVVEEDAIIALDTGNVTVWMNRNFRQSNQKILFSGYWRSMGFGLPAALAAKLACPHKQVIAVVGDGGLQMTLADLLTASQYKIDITVIVFNNGSLQMESDKIRAAGDEEEGTQMLNPNFVSLALACGWRGYQIEEGQEMELILEEAIRIKGPTLVDVFTEQAFFPETEE